MLEQKQGKIINIGDPSGESPWPSFIPYGITKSGIIAMTKGLAKALAPHVQVNCVNPGPVLIPEYYSAKERSRAIERTLLKREGSADDIAEVKKDLDRKKQELANEYKALMKEKEQISKDKKKIRSKRAAKKHNKIILIYNEKIKDYERRKKAFNTEVEKYNILVEKELEEKLEKRQKERKSK